MNEYKFAYTVGKEHPWKQDGFTMQEAFLALFNAGLANPKGIFNLDSDTSYRHKDSNNGEVYIIKLQE